MCLLLITDTDLLSPPCVCFEFNGLSTLSWSLCLSWNNPGQILVKKPPQNTQGKTSNETRFGKIVNTDLWVTFVLVSLSLSLSLSLSCHAGMSWKLRRIQILGEREKQQKTEIQKSPNDIIIAARRLCDIGLTTKKTWAKLDFEGCFIIHQKKKSEFWRPLCLCSKSLITFLSSVLYFVSRGRKNSDNWFQV